MMGGAHERLILDRLPHGRKGRDGGHSFAASINYAPRTAVARIASLTSGGGNAGDCVPATAAEVAILWLELKVCNDHFLGSARRRIDTTNSSGIIAEPEVYMEPLAGIFSVVQDEWFNFRLAAWS